jgi:UDPglucose 6-dehydrogenase
MKRICVIGSLGYVGLVTAAGLAELGHQVIGVDLAEDKIKEIVRGHLPFYEPGFPELVRCNLARGRLSFTTSLKDALSESEITFIAVGSPATHNGQADLSQIFQVAEDLGKYLTKYQVVVMKSTVGSDGVQTFLQILQEAGRHDRKDFDLVSNPEFLREGHAVNDFLRPDRIVIGGSNPVAAQQIKGLYQALEAPIVETTLENALMIKYAANAYLAARISFINEVANICEHVRADVRAVIQGMGLDRRIGQGYLCPGLGFGGPCLQKDLSALIHMAESGGYIPHFLKAALAKNAHQVERILAKVRAVLGLGLQDKVVAALGLAFKPRTSDVRNSLAIRIITELHRYGVHVQAYDYEAMEAARPMLNGTRLVTNPYEACKGAHVLLILCAWEEFQKLDLKQLRASMAQPIIIDGVNALDAERARAAGFCYQGVGQ